MTSCLCFDSDATASWGHRAIENSGQKYQNKKIYTAVTTQNNKEMPFYIFMSGKRLTV